MKPTLPIHIVSKFTGEQDAQFMIIQITQETIEAILEGRRLLASFNATHGNWQRLEHFDVNIILLSEFPEGFGLGLDLDADPYMVLADGPLVLPFAPDEAFIQAALARKLLHSSECERIKIDTLGRLEAAAYVKHTDELLISEDFAPVLNPILHPLSH